MMPNTSTLLEVGLGVGLFTLVILVLVFVILAARSKLVAGGSVQITINDDKELQVPTGGKLMNALAEVGIFSAVQLFGTYSGSRADMTNWLEGAEINTDGNLRLQYLAGLGLNEYQTALSETYGPCFETRQVALPGMR